LRFSYDPPSDELNIRFGKPRPAVSKEIEGEIPLRLDPRTVDDLRCDVRDGS
jgi:hypothetical protein